MNAGTLRVLVLAVAVLLALTACGGPRSLDPDSQSTWDVVIIGDSSLWDVGPQYAALIEQQRGAKVNLQDMWQPALRAHDVLRAMRGEETNYAAFEDLREIIRDAEVLVLFANPLDEDYQLPGDWNCIGEPYYARDCPPEALAGYEADLSAIWAEVVEIRSGVPIVARAVDIYNPLISEWAEAGVAAECTACWENAGRAAARAAAAHDVPFVSIYDAFNGPGHDEDPREKGYTKDGEHPSAAGAAFYAEVLAGSGFDAATVK